MRTENSPPKGEAGFIAELEQKSLEQRKLALTQMMPDWAKGLGNWLVINPWRVLVPVAGILYFGLRIMLGTGYRDFILGLFGGFAR